MVLLRWDAGQGRLKAGWKTQQWNGVRRYQPREFKAEKKYGSRIYFCSWMLEGRFPVPYYHQRTAESVNRICGLRFVYEQMLKRTLLGEQCLYRQRHLMLYEHPKPQKSFERKAASLPRRSWGCLCVQWGALRCKNVIPLCQQEKHEKS